VHTFAFIKAAGRQAGGSAGTFGKICFHSGTWRRSSLPQRAVLACCRTPRC
jgi:hypothetical protein